MKGIEAAKLIAMLQAAWPRGAWPPETCQIYEANIIDLEADIALAAINHLVRANTFQPSIGEIFAEADKLTTEYREAWRRLSRELAMQAADTSDGRRILDRKIRRFETISRQLGRDPGRMLPIAGTEPPGDASADPPPPSPTDPAPCKERRRP